MKKLPAAILFILALGVIPLTVFCQKKTNSDSLRIEKLPLKVRIKYADALFNAGNYYDAIEQYRRILNEKPNEHYAMYMLAESYFKARDYVSAEKFYGEVISTGADSSAFPLVYYRLAMMQKMNGKYEAAKYTFAKFSLRASGDYVARARREIDACDFAKAAVDNPGQFKVTHLDAGVNTPFSEFAPTVLGGKLYYSSFNHDTVMLSAEGSYLSHVYFSEKNSTAWAKGKLVPPPANSNQYHTGNVSFSSDGKRMYFTQCTDQGEANIICQIMLSIFENGAWKEPVALSESVNSEETSNTHPAAAFGDSLTDIVYFTSNRPGSRGGNDLWYTEVKFDGTASIPVNLGSVINTVDDEITPFYYKNKLYFSSNGHIGLGGYDVFSSSGLKSGWAKPQNLGSPLNSSVDDFYFSKGESPKLYYFVSNRAGTIGLKSPTCCDDIFMSEDLSVPKFTVRGVIVEKGDTAMVAVTAARVEIVDITDSGRKPVNDVLLTGDYKYSFELVSGKVYEVKIQKKGYFPQTYQLDTKNMVESETFDRDITLEKIEKNKAYRLDYIYYEFNKTSLSDESEATLRKLYELLVENPKLVVEVGSHTDDIGKPNYNLDLSQKRAQSCVDYLIYLGIEAKRLIAKGYGESLPVASNKKPDGSDNEEGRKLNRRTEFKVVGELSRVGDKIIYD